MSKITGMTLVAENRHNNNLSAGFIRKDLKFSVKIKQGAAELIAVEMSGVVVHSVYKLRHNHSYYYKRYWKCFKTVDGLMQRVQNDKLLKSFNNARWKKG